MKKENIETTKIEIQQNQVETTTQQKQNKIHTPIRIQKDVAKIVSTLNLDSNQSFVITPDYIQQTIKNALKQENLNPDIEEKLINLQRYQERQMKTDNPTSTTTPSTSTSMTPANNNNNLISSNVHTFSPPQPVNTPRKRAANTTRASKKEDEVSAVKKSNNNNVCLNFGAFAAAKTTENNNLSLAIGGDSKGVKNENDKKKTAAQLTRLHRHKELLKKDILKKRAILERVLHIEIQREIEEAMPELQKNDANNSNSFKSDSDEQSPRNNNQEIQTSTKQKKGSKFPGMSKKREKLYCICKTPYDDTKFYVGCDLCSNWFHGDCVDITEEASKKLSEFICEECRRARETQELYCSCKQPYDESQFYICCDKCQDWFHGRCVGIVQSEAEFIDEYICPDCQRNNDINMANMKNLTSNEFEELKKLMKQVQNHKNAWPFMEPVDPEEAPDYYKVIKEPMDLKKIEKKINAQIYTKLSEFIGDMTKIFDNCRYYNPKESAFYKCAESVEGYFVQKIKNFRETVANSSSNVK